MAGFIPAIHVFLADAFKDVNARDKPGHDDFIASDVTQRMARRHQVMY
jgi:hypothetical protein